MVTIHSSIDGWPAFDIWESKGIDENRWKFEGNRRESMGIVGNPKGIDGNLKGIDGNLEGI